MFAHGVDVLVLKDGRPLVRKGNAPGVKMMKMMGEERDWCGFRDLDVGTHDYDGIGARETLDGGVDTMGLVFWIPGGRRRSGAVEETKVAAYQTTRTPTRRVGVFVSKTKEPNGKWTERSRRYGDGVHCAGVGERIRTRDTVWTPTSGHTLTRSPSVQIPKS